MAERRRWNEAELTLCLDLYLRIRDGLTGEDELKAMARLLDRTEGSIHARVENYKTCDPSYVGAGLPAGQAVCQPIWNKYEGRLNELAESVRQHSTDLIVRTSYDQGESVFVEPEAGEYAEGKVAFVIHVRRERSRSLASKVKEKRLLESGKLECEACGFNFERVYGSRGTGFIEAHHDRPVSTMSPGEKTRLDDMTLLCSNCHRMVHRSKPWISVDQLKGILDQQ